MLQRLSAKYRVPVQRQQLSMFLTSCGTLISIWSLGGQELCSPLFDRLATSGTILRDSQDPSLLLYALLDVVVDE